MKPPQSDEKKNSKIALWIPVIVAIIGCLGTITAAFLDPDLIRLICPRCEPSPTASPAALPSSPEVPEPYVTEYSTPLPYLTPPTFAVVTTTFVAPSSTHEECSWKPYPQHPAYTQCLNMPEWGITSKDQSSLAIFMDELFQRKFYGFFRPIESQGKISVNILINNLVASELWIGVSGSEDPRHQSLMIIFQPSYVVDIRRYENQAPFYLENNRYIADLDDTIADSVTIEIVGTRVNCTIGSVYYRGLVSLPFTVRSLFVGYQLLPGANSAARIDVKITGIQDK